MQTKHKKRLIKLADYLVKSVKDNEFDLENFRIHTAIRKGDTVTACRSTACAIGYMPEVFPRHIEYSDPFEDASISELPQNKTKRLEIDIRYRSGPNRGWMDNFQLAQDWFGLTENECYYLFYPDYYFKKNRTRKGVAERIRKFVKTGTIDPACPNYEDISVSDDDCVNLSRTF